MVREVAGARARTGVFGYIVDVRSRSKHAQDPMLIVGAPGHRSGVLSTVGRVYVCSCAYCDQFSALL